ncbi:PaaI family thioesterase, partial [Salmonella enterica subsp. enterica serovar Minnesota]|uniref:PaaI family thioesterase n=1 Tax=Salmonella enterica TaxID=28901 RepID=UPI003D27B24F
AGLINIYRPGMAATGFLSADELNALLPGTLPGSLGVVIDSHDPGRLTAHLDVRPEVLAPNGYLHAATVVGLADTACGLA